MTTLKVGLIGCGRIAQQAHLPNLVRLPGIELVAYAEPEAERRAQAARLAPRALAFQSYEELLNRAKVHAVVVCLPNAFHAEATIAALERGLHVYLEKPLATSSTEALRVIEAWRRAGVVGMMGFNYRFNKLYESMRARLNSGALGEPATARTVFSTAAKNLPEWKLDRRTGGGVLFDLASHHLDLVRYFFEQEVSEVYAEIQSRRSACDSAMLQMRLTGGASVQSFFSTSGVEEDSFEIYGERGKLSVNRYLSLDVRHSRPTLEGVRLGQLHHALRSLVRAPYLLKKMGAAVQEPSYLTALERFVAAVRAGASPKPDFYDGYYNLQIIEAAERSAATGCKARVKDASLSRLHESSEPERDLKGVSLEGEWI
jgi:predicted dehydrogenase